MAYQSRRKPEIDISRLIAAGCIPGASHVNKFGRNSNLTTNQNQIISETGGSAAVWPTTGCVLTLVSTSASDSASGAGAQELKIYGLDVSGVPITETASLNGTSTTQTSASFWRVYRMQVPTAGSKNFNQGIISACAGGSAISSISPGNNQTLMAVYTVPACTVGLINSFFASVNKSTTVAAGTAAADIRGWARTYGETFKLSMHAGLTAGATSTWAYQYDPPFRAAPLTDLYMSACVDDTGTDVSAGFDITLLEQ